MFYSPVKEQRAFGGATRARHRVVPCRLQPRGRPAVAFLWWHHPVEPKGSSSSGFAEPWCGPGGRGTSPPNSR